MDFDTSEQNREFWEELCGTSLAISLGIDSHSPKNSDIEIYDKYYLNFYPYLLQHVPVHTFSGCDVLEIGLGWGTLGQKIAEQKARYTGVDIAKAPVDMMRYRLNYYNLIGESFQCDFLNNKFPDNTFDIVVSIGCFHHTGDVPRCVSETHRILRPGGKAFIMLYNKYSLRHWLRWPLKTLGSAFTAKKHSTSTRDQRAAYDLSVKGEAAPHTDFHSVKECRNIFSSFESISIRKANCDPLFNLRGISLLPRSLLLPVVGPLLGLDLYIKAEK